MCANPSSTQAAWSKHSSKVAIMAIWASCSMMRRQSHAAWCEDAADATQLPRPMTLPVASGEWCNVLLVSWSVSWLSPVNPLRSIRTYISLPGGQWEASDGSGWPIRGHQMTHSASLDTAKSRLHLSPPACFVREGRVREMSCLVTSNQARAPAQDSGGKLPAK